MVASGAREVNIRHTYHASDHSLSRGGAHIWSSFFSICRAFDEGRRYALGALLHLVMGSDDAWTSPAAFEKRSVTFARWRAGLFSLPLPLPGTAFWKAMIACQELLRLIREGINKVKARLDLRDSKYNNGCTSWRGAGLAPRGCCTSCPRHRGFISHLCFCGPAHKYSDFVSDSRQSGFESKHLARTKRRTVPNNKPIRPIYHVESGAEDASR